MSTTRTSLHEERTIDLDGPVHYADFGGEGPTVVLVHGLGGSYTNWLALGPLLAARARVLALDLGGFGRTPHFPHGASVSANRRLLDRFIERAAGGRAILVGNSMGGAISLMESVESPDRVAGLVLVDPAQPRPSGAPFDGRVVAHFGLYALPWIGELFVKRRMSRLGAERMVAEMLGMCCVDVSRIPREVYEAHVELSRLRFATMPWAAPAFLEAARSLVALLFQRGRYRKLVGRSRAPALLVQGEKDRLVPVEGSRELARSRPDWTYVELDDIGHVPQLEAAPRLAGEVFRWLDGAGAACRSS